MATKMVRHNTNNNNFSAFALGHHSINVIHIKVQLLTIKNYYIFSPPHFEMALNCNNQLMNIQISEHELNIIIFFSFLQITIVL